MTTNMSMSALSSYSMSPLAHSAVHGDFPSYVSVKTETHHSYSPSHRHGCSQGHNHGFQNSPQGLSSCMYAASLSPCMLASPSPDHCLSIVSTKENNNFRGVPTCRRRLDFNHNAFLDVTKVGPVAVAKRNERERNRVKLINMTFQTLRQHLPLGSSGVKGKSRKLSKVQTLRSAIDYIRQLQDMVHSRQYQQQQSEYHSKGDDQKTSVISCNGDFKASYQVNSIDIGSPSHRDDPKGYFMCQTICGSASLSEDEPTQKIVTSPRPQTDCTSSSTTTNCSVGSPFSDGSCYDAVTTADDEEYIDFDDWF